MYIPGSAAEINSSKPCPPLLPLFYYIIGRESNLEITIALRELSMKIVGTFSKKLTRIPANIPVLSTLADLVSLTPLLDFIILY